MVAKKSLKQTTAKKILEHVDRPEIISKLSIGVEPENISEWLAAKYADADKSLVLSKRELQAFSDEYLDFYNQVQEDAFKVRSGNDGDVSQELQSAVHNNSSYKDRLNEYVDKEISIKEMVRKLVIGIEARAEQVFDYIQEDNRNMKNDRVLIDWFNLLLGTLEKYEPILNGQTGNVVNQNTININIVDQQIAVFRKVIAEVISQFDYDTYLLFMERFNEEMSKLKFSTAEVEPIDVRLSETKNVTHQIETALLAQ